MKDFEKSVNAEDVGTRPSKAPFASASAAAGYAPKPPLGIIPRQLCVEKRMDEIVEAIGRYHQAHYIIPVEWFEEAAEIKRWLDQRKDPRTGHTLHPNRT